ncbi:MAG TPA: hypothetical protein VFR03_18305 [Thermoanaerobaculia bacterium]|nr:hypothetical protein [Thermoanaerobaculia bacterium]
MKLLQFILLTLAFLVAGVAAAATLADPAGAAALPAVTAAQPAGCQPVLDLGKLAPAKGETCPATAAPQTKTPEPEFMAQPTRLKTCVCSCGYPCTSDADCGGALGSCRAGITCC